MIKQIDFFIGSSTMIRRLAAAAILGSALLGSAVAPASATPCYFGECGQAPTAPTSEFRVIASHGSWTAQTNGRLTFVSNRFDDGAEFAIADKDGQLYLVFNWKNWHWQEGKTFPLKVDVDGEIYNGTIEAKSSTMLISSDIKKEFVNVLHNAHKAKFEVAGDTFTITTLNDGAATIDDAVRYQRSASR